MPDKADLISAYIREISSLPKEAPRRHRFTLLLGSLFGDKLASDVILGIEKLVRVYSKNVVSRGFIDTYYGDIIIEFESNLDVKIEEAESQLREYVAGVWEEEGKPLARLAVATDGIRWQVFYPILREGSKRPWTSENVELHLTESRTVKTDEADDFYFWLSRLFLRDSLLRPTVKSFEDDFGLSSPAFIDASTLLRQAFNEIKQDSEPKLLFETWAKYLRYSYGKFDPDENLFVIHSYLAAFARLLVWAVFSKGKVEGSLRAAVRSVFEGDYFKSWGIENLAEKDFYYWVLNPKVENKLVPIWTRIINHILTYDLSIINQDILKGVYQQLVDENTRHGLGEYYTPEWLCEKMVQEIILTKGMVKVLDPSCGSGSFLRAVLAHYIKENKDSNAESMLKRLLDTVVGFDINPLAVLISRATYAIAIREFIKKAIRPVSIPVYLSDTLFLPKEITQPELGKDPIPLYEIEFGDKIVELPAAIVMNSQDFDLAISCCSKVALSLSTKKNSENKNSLKNFLLKENPSIASHIHLSRILDGLWDLTEKLADLIVREKNSIWGYILKNSYRPSMLKKDFDIIIGNPPWLSYRYIEDPRYQEEIKELGLQKYEVAPKKQKLMTQMEIATIFLLHSLTTFGNDTSEIAFVMPRSILNADQHEKFRNGTYSTSAEVLRYWDLRQVQPLFRVPACVVFLGRTRFKKVRSQFPVTEFEGRLPANDLPWSEAEKHLTTKNDILKLLHLGEHSALSTSHSLNTSGSKEHSYNKCFRQGSTIVPRNIYFVNRSDGDIVNSW